MSANDELQAHTCEKMLEFYGDVANNVAQGKVQDLTEQWKKGELKEREYYVKEKSGKITRRKIGGGIPIESKPEIIEVLAPVPSYEEWKAAYECQLMESELVLTLKELLKECRVYVENCEQFNAYDFEMLKTIDNVIGEKK